MFYFQVVDASRSMEEVGRDVCRLVQEALDNITPDSALKQLWI
jgi:dTMP kinase